MQNDFLTNFMKAELDFNEPFKAFNFMSTSLGKKLIKKAFDLHLEEFKEKLHKSKETLRTLSEMLTMLDNKRPSVYKSQQNFIRTSLRSLCPSIEVLNSTLFEKVFEKEVNRSDFLSEISNSDFGNDQKLFFNKMIDKRPKDYSAKIKIMLFDDFKLYFRETKDRRIENLEVKMISYETNGGVLYLNPMEETLFFVKKDDILYFDSTHADHKYLATKIKFGSLKDINLKLKNHDEFYFEKEYENKTFKVINEENESINCVKVFDEDKLIIIAMNNKKYHLDYSNISFALIDESTLSNKNVLSGLIGFTNENTGFLRKLENKSHSDLLLSIFGECSEYKSDNKNKSDAVFEVKNLTESMAIEASTIIKANVKI